MNKSILLAVSVGALALAGCKKEQAPTGDVVATPEATEAVVPVSSPTANPDQAFADEAAASDAFEVQTSELAASKASSAKVKQFAQAMIKAHTDSTAKLKAAAGSVSPSIVPNPQLTPAQQSSLDELSNTSGAAFDTAYAKAQVAGHEMTLAKLKAYAANGGQPTLKSFATALVPTVTAHYNMAKAL